MRIIRNVELKTKRYQHFDRRVSYHACNTLNFSIHSFGAACTFQETLIPIYWPISSNSIPISMTAQPFWFSHLNLYLWLFSSKSAHTFQRNLMQECKIQYQLKLYSQMLIGCVYGLVSIFMSSFVTNFWAFLLLYACGFGICNGIAVKTFILTSLVYCTSVSKLEIFSEQ